MIFNVGDIVSRNSYNNDVIFKIIKIENDKAYLKGVEVRLLADAPTSDLKVCNEKNSDFFDLDITNKDKDRNGKYFYLPGRILHLDGDSDYLETCLKFYKSKNVFAIGKKIKEENIPNQITILLNKYKPDILVLTGHDAYYKKKGSKDDINNYKNSKYFVDAVKIARNYEKSHEKLVIIAGACQSYYEEIIKAGANFASSPKRINIHALDPAIIATCVAITEKNKEIDLIELLNKTKYGIDGMGGLIGNGLMYVGYPR